MPHSCVGIFCEDIREEVIGSHTIVGVMPDNINLAGPVTKAGESLLFPKMGMYVRVNLDSSQRPKAAVSVRTIFPGIPDVPLGEVALDVIAKAFDDASDKASPLVGLIFKAVVSPMQFTTAGMAFIIVTIDDTEYVAAALNIQLPQT